MRLLWIAVVVLGLGAAVAFAIPMFVGTRLSASAARPVQFTLLPAHSTTQTLTQTFAPGLYKATPHSMLVLVPREVDPGMIYRPDTSAFRTPVYQPPGHLEKR